MLDRLLTGQATGGIALVDGDIRLAADEVRERAAHLAGGLAAAGVGRGDVVSWQLPNGVDAVVAYRACWRLGAVAAPIHHRDGAAEVARKVARLRPTVHLTASPAVRTESTPNRRPRATSPGEPAESTPNRCTRATTVGELAGHDAADVAVVHPDDRAAVLFTSGSSSEPKGVVHTHRSLAHKASTMAAVHRLGADDVVLMPAPLAHVSGLLNGVLLPGAAGMKVVLVDRWDPGRALELIEREQVSFMVGPPTFFLGLMEQPALSPDRVASLRVVSCGGTGVTPAFVERASAVLGARVKRSYGSTEAPTITTWHDGDPSERAATTDGRAVGDVELRLADPPSGEPIPRAASGGLGARFGGPDAAPGSLGLPGSSNEATVVGELWVRGPEVFAGYLDDTGGTAGPGGPDAEGWFRTGDLATIDEGGWVTVVGRTTDVIIRGGENIAPGEIEAALEDHPAVRRAVAVGLPDERFGEVPAAVVVADGPFGTDDCAAWFAQQGVARFKMPVRVLRVDDVPLLGSGKPDRRAALDLLARTAAGASRPRP